MMVLALADEAADQLDIFICSLPDQDEHTCTQRENKASYSAFQSLHASRFQMLCVSVLPLNLISLRGWTRHLVITIIRFRFLAQALAQLIDRSAH